MNDSTTPHPMDALTEAGVSVWLDDLSRDSLNSGDLAEKIAIHRVTGVTTNPSIFATALADGAAYSEQVAALCSASVDEAIRALTTTDVATACDTFHETFEATDGVDGRVSIEVSPALAHETDETVEQAEQLYRTVDRENVLIKIPATMEGLEAIRRTLAKGISVNVTLIFSVQRYREVMDAWLSGLEQAQEAGLDISRIHSVASFFISRIDAEMDERLERIGSEEALALRGLVALANARLAYAEWMEMKQSDRCQALLAAGAHVQRPLWASTSVKNDDYPDTLYVTELVAPQTVNTMPESTLLATADHAEISGDTITGRLDEARQVMGTVTELGIDFEEVAQQLEDEGVDKFAKSWDELTATVTDALNR